MINFIKNNQKYFTIGGACILLLLTAQQRSQIKELKNQQHLCTIYALNIRELFLKACIFEYAYIKKNFKENSK